MTAVSVPKGVAGGAGSADHHAARIRRVDAEILTAVRQQAASGGCSRRGARGSPVREDVAWAET